VRTDRFALRLRPAQAEEHVLRATLGHSHDLGRTERTSGGRQEKVLRHEGPRQEDVAGIILEISKKYKLDLVGGGSYIIPYLTAKFIPRMCDSRSLKRGVFYSIIQRQAAINRFLTAAGTRRSPCIMTSVYGRQINQFSTDK
jgi:hypothetical protein